MTGVFTGLPRSHFGAILADPPWRFKAWSGKGTLRAAENHYETMSVQELSSLPVGELAADNCVLFLWVCWPSIKEAIGILETWGFVYKTCAFNWTKAHAGQIELFQDEVKDQMGLGYWTRANTEPCLLATRGKPRRLHADVRQAIISPRREHSRKPTEIHARIERLVSGPYLELFSRQGRANWTHWGNETNKFAVMSL